MKASNLSNLKKFNKSFKNIGGVSEVRCFQLHIHAYMLFSSLTGRFHELPKLPIILNCLYLQFFHN